MKFFRIFWGLFFIAAAGSFIGTQTGIITTDLPVFTIIASIVIIAILIHSIFSKSIVGIIFSLAFEVIVLSGPFGWHIGAFTILTTALLLAIGISIIFHDSRIWHHGEWMMHHRRDMYRHAIDPDVETINGTVDGHVEIDNRFTGSIRYVQESDFKSATITAYMAGTKVYFDKSTIQGDSANIILDIDLSGTDIFVPADWNLNINVNNYMGGIEEKGRGNTDGPKVNVTGRVRMSGLTIHYV